MKGHGEKLTRKKERAIKALLECDTHADAAKASGVSVITLWRWMKNPEFKEAFREGKRRLLAESITRLQQATGKAIKALLDVIEDKNAPASARVSGAKTILDTAIKAIEIEDLEARVEEIEESILNRRGHA